MQDLLRFLLTMSFLMQTNGGGQGKKLWEIIIRNKNNVYGGEKRI